MRNVILLIACLLSVGIHAQNSAVTKQLRGKYSIVEYNKGNGGWYLIGKQTGTETQYGFCNKMGKVIAFGGREYKVYDAFIEFYMPDPAMKKEYDEWKRKHDEWEQEKEVYDRLDKQYTSKRNIIAEKLLKEEEEKQKQKDSRMAWYNTPFSSTYYWSEAESILLKQGIEKPVLRDEPRQRSNGYKWVQYTFIQPQPYQEIDYDELKNENLILCSVKKNGLYGLVNKDLKNIVPCTYKKRVETSYTLLNGTCQKYCINGKYGVVNKSGIVILKDEYKEISETENGLLKVTKDGKLFGIYDTNGKEVLPCIFADVSFAIKKSQSFSSFARNYVEQFVNEWQKKGEYEKTADWQVRVNEQKRQQKIVELTKQAQVAYLGLYANNIKDDFTIGKYDPDHETFLIESKIGGKLLVPVPIAKAENFKNRFTECSKKPSYFIQNDGIGLAKCEFRLSQNEVYTFNNQASLNYSIAQVEYNFDPININPVASENNRGKQTISTISLNVGKSDVDVDIPVNSTNNDKTFAVIISNENYQNEKKVDFANNDGWMFKEYCQKTLGIPSKNIPYKADATSNNIKYELNWIKQVAEAYSNEANVIFYFAGHGVPDEYSKEAYLLPIDAISSDVSTGISLKTLYKNLGDMPANKVLVFLDACFSGALRGNGMLASARGVAIKSKIDEPQGNMIVFSAASGQETAYPYKTKNHGMFTYFVLKKMKESKGNMTLDELSNYVITNVKQQSIVVNGKSQTPTVTTSMSVSDSWKNLRLK